VIAAQHSQILARTAGQAGRSDEARRMLTEIYNWFTEGFDTADLKEAVENCSSAICNDRRDAGPTE
jgi:hypothetical protein